MYIFILVILFHLTIMKSMSESIYIVPISRLSTGKRLNRLNNPQYQRNNNDSMSPGSTAASLFNFVNAYFTANVTIGTGQTFKVDLDTGSSDFWLRGPNCNSTDGSCGEKADVSKQLGVNLKDTALISTGKNFTNVYGSGTVAGDVYKTTVNFAGVNVTMNMGATVLESGYASLNADGLMGLAFPSLNNIEGSNFLEAVASRGVDQTFGFYLSNAANGDNGEFTLGGYDSTKFKGNITWLPVVDKKYWGFSTDGGSFHVGKATGKLSGTYIADTGTSLLILNNDTMAMEINTAIGAKLDPKDGYYHIDCAVAKTGPDFKLTINGNNFTIPANICT
jgi:hypothetical protein